MDSVEEIIRDSDLDKIINIVEKRVLEEDYTTLDLAAALLKMSMGDDYEDISVERTPLRSLDELEDYERGARNRNNGRGARSGSRGGRMLPVCSLISVRTRESNREIFWVRLPVNPECRAEWSEALTCSINIPLWKCRESRPTSYYRR